jgi:hypothetical protein
MHKLFTGLLLLTALPAVAAVTFTKDVAPIFYKRCVECHREGEVAPMSLLTYKDARPWAASIKEKVSARVMPPWLATAQTDHFVNSRRLSDGEIKTITAWVDAGAPKGNDNDLPAPPKFDTGWSLGKPDTVFQIPDEVPVPATGTIEYKYYTVPTNFTEDRWIQSAEIRAGNRAVVHHIIVFIQEPTPSGNAPRGEGRGGFNKLCGFAPGEQAKVFPEGTAKLIKAGSKLTFQVHYTTNGTAATDRSYVGLHFAKDGKNLAPALTGTATNASFVIPAGDGNYEAHASWTAPEDVRIIDLMPHMHVRGKDFKYTAVYPDGHSEVLLDVPKYDFNWQLLYRYGQEKVLPKGTRIDCVAHFDNSTANKYNPDPTKDVKWGDQTWEEMMIGWFDYTVATTVQK